MLQNPRGGAQEKEPFFSAALGIYFSPSIFAFTLEINRLTNIKIIENFEVEMSIGDIFAVTPFNYSDSFETIQEYNAVSEDMERIHKEIGLPVKGTYTDVGTDPNTLKKLGKEDEENPSYTFLGITWDLKKNEVRPNTYFNLSKKLKGQSGEKKLMEI